jgi:hypothetical protein
MHTTNLKNERMKFAATVKGLVISNHCFRVLFSVIVYSLSMLSVEVISWHVRKMCNHLTLLLDLDKLSYRNLLIIIDCNHR